MAGKDFKGDIMAREAIASCHDVINTLEDAVVNAVVSFEVGVKEYNDLFEDARYSEIYRKS